MQPDNAMTDYLTVDDSERPLMLKAFVAESNRIESIMRPPSPEEIKWHDRLVCRKRVSVDDLVDFVAVVQPDARLRATTDVPNVRVGEHVAPASGPEIVTCLNDILSGSRGGRFYFHQGKPSPYLVHLHFDSLHPFTDGNGRAGRALWLWQMRRIGQERKALALGFLHCFYYQTLGAQQ